VVATLVKEKNVDVEWMPFYLRPDTPPEGMELPDYIKDKMKETNPRLAAMAEAAEMPMVFATRIPNTRLAHEATEYAREEGKHLQFHHEVFQAFYGQGQDISKWEVLRAAATAAGLNPDQMQTQVQSGRYTEQVNQMVAQAQNIGVHSVPMYVLNNRYAIAGAQPYQAFQQIIEKYNL
jgi:predicted DsbA family dithiol-disulfide isomerase